MRTRDIVFDAKLMELERVQGYIELPQLDDSRDAASFLPKNFKDVLDAVLKITPNGSDGKLLPPDNANLVKLMAIISANGAAFKANESQEAQ